ncbi:MAG: S1 RNA-binding domain-containing protein [Anaerolineales bacterium]|nr:S1 RNA-binding domain-containing protein [Anaerolineales bacterium]
MPGGRNDFSEQESMARMLEGYLACSNLERGQIVTGIVVRASENEVFVDVNAKCEGVVPERDLAKVPANDRAAIQAGDEVLVYVVDPEDANGNITLSLSRAMFSRDWVEARQLLESQEVTEKEVVACNKGGVIVQVGRLRGFVPGSQLSTDRADRRPAASGGEDRWSCLVGETLRLKVIEADQPRGRLILSERAALRDWQKSHRGALLAELAEGTVCEGRVASLTDFGAFVDLGGIDGLVHLSELSWKRVLHPREVVAVGQEVQVVVLSVERERQRVSLSLKRLEPDPWVSVEERYAVGQLVEGLITRLTKWGAFARLVGDEAIEGMIHVSELDDEPVEHPSERLQQEQVVTLRIIGVDAAKHRLALSLKQAVCEETAQEEWRGALAAEHTEPDRPVKVALAGPAGPAQGADVSATPGQGVLEKW